jgi:flagellar basal body-associated protein FliL
MSKDYARRQSAQQRGYKHVSRKQEKKAKKRSSMMPMLCLLTGLLVGLFAAGLVYLSSQHQKEDKKPETTFLIK